MFKFVQIILKQRHFEGCLEARCALNRQTRFRQPTLILPRYTIAAASIVDWQFRVFIAIADSWQIVRFPSASKKESRISGFHGWMFLGFKSKEKNFQFGFKGFTNPKDPI